MLIIIKIFNYSWLIKWIGNFIFFHLFLLLVEMVVFVVAGERGDAASHRGGEWRSRWSCSAAGARDPRRPRGEPRVPGGRVPERQHIISRSCAPHRRSSASPALRGSCRFSFATFPPGRLQGPRFCLPLRPTLDPTPPPPSLPPPLRTSAAATPLRELPAAAAMKEEKEEKWYICEGISAKYQLNFLEKHIYESKNIIL